MSSLEWFLLLVYMVVLVLLFFAAFGGSNLNEHSVEEYMGRLLNESNEENLKK
tara:strand:- start:166 stop:324 length:159 start_codon:yes stop_codon:yes gene_type:complete